MSDSLASERTLERPSQGGQVERASEAQPQGSTGGQPSDNGQVAKNNVAEIQRIKDREINDLRKTFEAQQRQAQQQIQALQQQMWEAQKNAAPDDYSKLEVELRQLRQERDQFASAYQQEVAEKQAERERMSALREIADEFDVSVKDLEDATDYKSAVKLALKAQQEKDKRKQEQDNDKRERNMPDLGGGAPTTAVSEWERQWADAEKSGDSLAMMRLDRTRPKAGRR